MEIQVRLDGPVFGPGALAKVRQAVVGAIDDLVERGEEKLGEMLRPRPAGVYLSVQEAKKGRASTGHYRRSVHGERKELLGRIHDSNVVYGPWLEGVSSRNQATRFKGYGMWRKTGDWLQGQVSKVVEAHIRKLVRDLGGRE